MTFTRENVLEAHKLSSNNYDAVCKSDRSCCFYCGELFVPGNDTISIFKLRHSNERTAVHIRCGVDAVIGDSQTELVKDMRFVAAMRYYWFDIDSPYETTEEENE